MGLPLPVIGSDDNVIVIMVPGLWVVGEVADPSPCLRTGYTHFAHELLRLRETFQY